MTIATALFAGLIFGLGLILSGMGDPGKVIAFLDMSGNWDPSLVLVMGAAIPVAFIGFRLAGQRRNTLLGGPMDLPVPGAIDARLLGGAALFGIGWGLAGICPAPGLILVGSAHAEGLLFVVAMLAGMAVHQLSRSR